MKSQILLENLQLEKWIKESGVVDKKISETKRGQKKIGTDDNILERRSL